jgi:hypothetical protein
MLNQPVTLTPPRQNHVVDDCPRLRSVSAAISCRRSISGSSSTRSASSLANLTGFDAPQRRATNARAAALAAAFAVCVASIRTFYLRS